MGQVPPEIYFQSSVPKKQPNPIDVQVGNRVRIRRMLIGMSQERLGDLLGLTFQQVQKYEKGVNRIGAGRLYEVSRILNVPVGYFFEGMTDVPQNGHHPAHDSEMVASRETLELVRAYYRIEDPTVRRRLVDLLRSLGPDAVEH